MTHANQSLELKGSKLYSILFLLFEQQKKLDIGANSAVELALNAWRLWVGGPCFATPRRSICWWITWINASHPTLIVPHWWAGHRRTRIRVTRKHWTNGGVTRTHTGNTVMTGSTARTPRAASAARAARTWQAATHCHAHVVICIRIVCPSDLIRKVLSTRYAENISTEESRFIKECLKKHGWSCSFILFAYFLHFSRRTCCCDVVPKSGPKFLLQPSNHAKFPQRAFFQLWNGYS